MERGREWEEERSKEGGRDVDKERERGSGRVTVKDKGEREVGGEMDGWAG